MNDWQKWMIAAVLALIMAMMGIQWQQAESDAKTNATELHQLEARHETDIARLDESMRTRRNQIADLEERIAILEERTK